MNPADESELLRQAPRADVNPAIKSWLQNVIVPAMVQRWIEENGGKTATNAPPPAKARVKI